MAGEVATRWVVVQSAEQRPDVSDDATIVIVEDLLSDVPVEDYDEIYGRFRRSEGPSIGDIPLYDVLWQRLAIPFNGFPDNPSSLAHQVVLFRELESLLSDETVGAIECHGLEPEYRALLADFARANDIEAQFEVSSRRHHVSGLLRGLVSLLIVILDGFLSLLLRTRFDYDRSVPVIFVPHLNRFDAMRPVLEAANYAHLVVAPVSTIEWMYHRYRGRWDAPADFSPIPVGVYVSPRILVREITLFVRLLVDELLLGRFATEIKELVDREFDVRLNQSVLQALGNAYPANIGPLPNLWLAERLYRVTNAERVVIGSLSLRQQLFLVAADRVNVYRFHVPHSVTTHYDVVPKIETVHIVPSSSDLAYHKRSDFLWQDSCPVIALGRPLLSSLAANRPPSEATAEPIRVLIATQPLNAKICHDFVSQIIHAFQHSGLEYTIVIKTHPTEDQGFYREYEQQHKAVTVSSGDLNGHITEADITFIIRTNVGIESVALGTPTVSVNQYEPFINTVPYISEGLIPVLRSPSELTRFVSELSPSRIDELRTEQVRFFDTNYLTDSDIAAEIAEFVRNVNPDDID